MLNAVQHIVYRLAPENSMATQYRKSQPSHHLPYTETCHTSGTITGVAPFYHHMRAYCMVTLRLGLY